MQLSWGRQLWRSPESNTYARRVESVGELIGGPGAIGEVGDYLIGNQKIRVVLQNQGWSRGFGIFGGGIIDADIVRPGTQVILDAAMVRIISVSSSRRSSYKLLTLRRGVNEMRTETSSSYRLSKC